jgi:hypothetical protein
VVGLSAHLALRIVSCNAVRRSEVMRVTSSTTCNLAPNPPDPPGCKGERRSFAETEYTDLLDATHQHWAVRSW